MREQYWREHAACLGHHPSLWFPEGSASPQPAIDICRGCRVQLDCLAHALAHPENHGIWGGLTETERNRRTTRRTS